MRLFFILGILFFAMLAMTDGGHAEPQAPSYAKWGKIAVEKTKEKYPQATVSDYSHIGRETGEQVSVEKFKLWLRTPTSEFGVFVDITFNNETEQIVDIAFRETTR